MTEMLSGARRHRNDEPAGRNVGVGRDALLRSPSSSPTSTSSCGSKGRCQAGGARRPRPA